MVRLACVFFALTACASAPPKAAPEPVHVPPPPPPVCLPESDGYLVDGSLEDTSFRYCRGDACVTYDLATQQAKPAAGPSEPAAEVTGARTGPFWRVDAEAKLAVCTTRDSTAADAKCRPVKLEGLALAERATPMANDSGSLVAVMLSNPKAKSGATLVAVVFETATGKRVAKKPVGDDSYQCGSLAFVGPSVLVALDVCAGPGGLAWLADPKTLKKIADVGPEGFGGYAPQFLPLGGTRFAFLEQGARSIVVQDVANGAIVSRVDFSDHYPKVPDSDEHEVPAYGGSFHRLASGDILVALAESRSGTFIVTDGDARAEKSTHAIPTCAEQ